MPKKKFLKIPFRRIFISFNLSKPLPIAKTPSHRFWPELNLSKPLPVASLQSAMRGVFDKLFSDKKRWEGVLIFFFQ